jgi:hypothetical protein
MQTNVQPMTEETAIVLKTRWHPLMVTVFFLFHTVVAIDGNASELPWGTHVFQVEPGTHEVRVSLGKGPLGRPVGEATIQTEVAQGEIVHLRYRAPVDYSGFVGGRIKVVR